MLVYMNNQQSLAEQEKTDNTGQTDLQATDRRQECRQRKTDRSKTDRGTDSGTGRQTERYRQRDGPSSSP